MLRIQAQVESLQITNARSDVGHFIYGYGFAQSRAPCEHCHQCKQQDSKESTKNAARFVWTHLHTPPKYTSVRQS